MLNNHFEIDDLLIYLLVLSLLKVSIKFDMCRPLSKVNLKHCNTCFVLYRVRVVTLFHPQMVETSDLMDHR